MLASRHVGPRIDIVNSLTPASFTPVFEVK